MSQSVQAPEWLCTSADVPAHSWRAIGTVDFSLAGVQVTHVVAGAVALGVNLRDVDLWCPAVQGAWIPLVNFSEACRGVAFRGVHALWARNRGALDCEVDVRFKIGDGSALAAPDLIAPYYASLAWREARYRGVQTLKCPLDLWILQEIVWDVRPNLIVETGTYRGGSALALAEMLDGLMPPRTGHVLTIDVEEQSGWRTHPRLTYLRGSSTDSAILAEVREWIEPGDKVLVVLDSDHSYNHVLAELRAYSPLVTQGSYLVVEDTNTPGPHHAVADFLASEEGRGFETDRARQKFNLTFNSGGWLRKGGGL